MPADKFRPGDDAGAGDQQGAAIAPDIAGQRRALLAERKGFDPPGIDEDILAGREKRQATRR